jgi:hypothetical protein
MIAEVLQVMAAEPTIAIDSAHPGHADPRSERQIRGRSVCHLSHDLMTGYDARSNRRQISLDDM